MVLNVEIGSQITIKSLSDLCMLGKLEELNKLNINKSQIAR
ncbi:MAG: hypothetical protein WBO70_06955 [Erysipelotrichaceae bacterium]